MTAGDVAGLVGEHTYQLIGVLGTCQKAGVHENPLPTGNKGIEVAIEHEMDRYGRWIERCRPKSRGCHCMNAVFDLGIAYNDGASRLLGNAQAWHAAAGESGAERTAEEIAS